MWAQLVHALGETHIGVSVWDPEDRLVYSNSRFRELFAPFGPFDGKPSYAEIFERATRLFKDRPAILSNVESRRHQRATRPASGEFLSGDNRVLRYHDVRTPGGGQVSLYQDVTREHGNEVTLMALVKAIPGAVFELRRRPDAAFDCAYMSEHIRELSGLGSEAFTADWNAALAELMSAADIDRLTASLDESATRLGDWRLEFPIRATDGVNRWLEARGSARRLRDGTLLWSGIVTDATQAVVNNAALAESEKRFRDIIDIASDWVWETDAEGRITFVSERFVEIAGLPAGQIVGRRREELPLYDWADPGAQALQEDMRERRPIHARRLRVTTASGARQISLRGRPMFDEAGEFAGYRGTGTDVTREHEYVQRLHEAMLEAQSANRAKSRFLANMSHDLRTPLNAIIGFSEMMQAEVFGPVGHPRYEAYMRDIRSSASHLLELIDDLLDLARIESGRVEMVEEQLAVTDLVDEAMILVAPRCEARGVVLTKECVTEVPVVHSDRRAVKQILVNLLTNASKFTERGGSILVRVEPDHSGGVWLTVRDDGCGISTSMIDEVTKPFVQASESSTRPRDGVGLGLAIVRSLTEAIGAEFRIESRLGVGTSISIRLPASRSARAA